MLTLCRQKKKKQNNEKTVYHPIPHVGAGCSGTTPADIVYRRDEELVLRL